MPTRSRVGAESYMRKRYQPIGRQAMRLEGGLKPSRPPVDVHSGEGIRRSGPYERLAAWGIRMQMLGLKLGFGYTPESVRLLLADRDKMFVRAAALARAAEAQVLELRAELEALKAQLEERQEARRPAETGAADLRTDRDATRMELDRAAATVAHLTTDVEAARRELEDARDLVRVAKFRTPLP